MGGKIGERIRAIREERGEKQPEYTAALNAAARRLKIPKNYSFSTVSRLETGRQEVTLEDILVIAQLDPQKRGRDWLAWGDSAVSVAEPKPHPPTAIEDSGVMTVDPYSVEARRVAGARTQGKRGRGR